jgi:hypothetical protein
MALRVGWATLPLAAVPAVDDALGATSSGVRTAAAVLLWATWGAALLALLAPRALGLTVLRLATPTAVVVTVAAAVAGGVEPVDLAAVTLASVTAALAFTPAVGEALVDGSSYGAERRLPLRAPSALLFGPVPLAAVAVVAGLATGPLLLAAGRGALGAVLTALGLALAVVAARSLHALARRWLVLVPGGVVIHDPLVLADPVLLPRNRVAAIAPARSDTDALDLTQGAAGLLVEIRMRAPVDLVLTRPGRRPDEVVTAAAVLVAPSRPSRLLGQAAIPPPRTSSPS